MNPTQTEALQAFRKTLKELSKAPQNKEAQKCGCVAENEKAVTLLDTGKYEELDKLLDSIAKSKEHCDQGQYLFEEIVKAFDDRSEWADKFQAWRKKTNSSHAHALSAYNEIDLAWEKRGRDWAHKVKEDGWKGFKEHLQSAKKNAEKALEIDESHPGALGALIVIAMGQSEGPKVIEERYLEAIKHHPGNGEFFRRASYASIPRWSGSTKNYIGFFQKHGLKAPADSHTFWTLTSLLDEIQDWNDAEDSTPFFKEAEIHQAYLNLARVWAEKYPNTTRPYSSIGWSVRKSHSYSLGEKLADLGLAKEPKSALLLRLKAECLYWQKMPKEAAEFFQKTLAVEPNNADTVYWYGWSLYRTEQYKEALKQFKKAAETLPRWNEKRRSISYAKACASAFHLKKYETAIKLGKESLAHNGAKHSPSVIMHLGKIAVAQGHPKNAKSYFLKAEKLDQEYGQIADEEFPGWRNW